VPPILVNAQPLPCQVLLEDSRYQAVQVLRLIGFVLSLIGPPCPVLWDPSDPWKDMYGPYSRIMCQ